MPRRSTILRYDPATDTVVEVEKTVARHLPRYPLAVEALAVSPDQISSARDFDAQNGVKTDYRGDGSPIFESKGHYKRYRQLHGFFDRSGYEQ